MRLSRIIIYAPLLVGGVGLVVTPGCGSRDAKYSSAKMSSEVKQVQAEVDDLRDQINDSTTALRQIESTRDGSDLKRVYAQFVQASERVDSRADRVTKRSQDMHARREAYLDDWNRNIAEVKDPAVKQTQQDRMQAVEQEFDQVSQRVDGLDADVTKLRRELADLRTAFQYDLTADGVKAMGPHIETAQTTATEAETQLADISKQLGDWSQSLRPTA
jgi:predicted  nucleic acid-binding Zn-ribbon protein